MGFAPFSSLPLPLRLQRLALWALAATLFGSALFFWTATRDQFELPKLLLMRALSSALVGLLLASRLMDPGLGWRRGALDWPVLAWALWLVVGTLGSLAPWVSWRGEYENFAGSLTQLNYALLYFAAVQVVRDREDAKLLLRSFVAAALGAALYALLQAQQRDLVAWAATSVVADRFFGPLGNPNFLAALMAMAIPLKLALALGDARRNGQPDPEARTRWALVGLWVLAYALAGKAGLLQLWQSRPHAQLSAQIVLWLWLAALILAPALRRQGRPSAAFWLAQAADALLLFQALANTGTRGAFLGLMIGLAVLSLAWGAASGRSLLSLRALGALGLLLVLLGGAFAGLGPSFRQRMAASLRDPALALEQSRLQIWVPAIKIWRDHPIAGSGVDTFKTVFPSYSRSRFSRYDGENVSSRLAHSEPLHIAATQGTVGLLLWLWLCGAFFRAWWSRVRAAGSDEAWWLGVGALVAAYLGQNLVSFGVAGISAAFWACLALPGLGDAKTLALPGRAWPPLRAALAGALALGLGLWAVSWTLRADLRYSYSTQAQEQLPLLERSSPDELRAVITYAYQRLHEDRSGLDSDSRTELDLWQQSLMQSEQRIQQDPGALAALTPSYRRAAGALLMLLSAHSMLQAVALAPHEVKYQVYLGLAYEELFRRAAPERRQLWFQRAAGAYRRSVELNPGNAYYRGNLGRLFGMGAEAGSEDFMAEAEAYYLEALERAPVTRLFYENLLLLYARYARLEGAAKLLDVVEARDTELAPGLLIAAASTFFQWRDSGHAAWTPQRRQAAAEAALDWGLRAQALRPDYGDQALALAVFSQALGRSAEARRWAAEAKHLKPGDPQVMEFLRQRGLER
jgi:O-antigen ligase